MKTLKEKLHEVKPYSKDNFSTIYKGKDIVYSRFGYRFLQDCIASGLLVKIKDNTEGAGLYKETI
jgi:hypothetical protein